MARPPREGVTADAVLNIRLKQEDKALLARCVAAEKADIAARGGADPSVIDLTAASLIRTWIRSDAKRRGFLPTPAQGVLFAEEPPTPAPMVVPAPVAATPAPAPVVPLPVSTTDVQAFVAAAPAHEAAVREAAAAVPAPVTEPPAVVEVAPVVAELPDDATLRAALDAAVKGGVSQATIANEAGLNQTSISKFKTGDRPLPGSDDGRRALAAVPAIAAELAKLAAAPAKPKRRPRK